MNPINALLGACTILVTLALLTGGCDKSSTSTATNNSGSQAPPAAQQAPPPIQAEPFHGQVYKSLNGRTVLTLVSKDECEIAEGGTTLLCKYAKQDGKLRVVTTTLGTSTVLYFRFTDQGLDDNKGNVLLSPESYSDAMEQLKRQQEEEQAAARKKQEEEEAKRQKEERRLEVVKQSKVGTKNLATFKFNKSELTVNLPNRLQFGDFKTIDGTMTLTDVGITIVIPPPIMSQPHTTYFHDIKPVGIVEKTAWGYGFVIPFYQVSEGEDKLYGELYIFDSQADATAAHDAIQKEFDSWKIKFPEAVRSN
jgi:hypothetical protein